VLTLPPDPNGCSNSWLRFDARHIGSGVWGVWDSGVMSWRGTDYSENEAKQRAADQNVMFDQYGDRDGGERREVSPPLSVESATWSPVGELDYWVREPFEWWGRVQGLDGHLVWIKAADLRLAKEAD
jgi:hypothetical protein